MTIDEALAMESEIAYCLLNSDMKKAVYTVFDALRERLGEEVTNE